MKISINKKILNEKYLQFYTDDTPTQIIFGSASSGKSFSIFTYVVLWALTGRSILVARKINRSLRKSVFSEMVKAISRLKLVPYFTINNTELTITCKVSNGSIICVGASDPERLKSITPIKASSFDCIIYEEVTELLEGDFDLINSRMRGTSDYKKKIILLFNPVSKQHWIFNRFFTPVNWDDELDMDYRSADLSITRCLYSDNGFLGEEEVKRMEALKTIAPRFWRVYGAGKFGITENSVFTNYKVGGFDLANINKLPIHCGIDHGYQHKSAFVVSLYDKVNRRIYVISELGLRGKTREEFGLLVKEKITSLAQGGMLALFNPQIYCDSSEPATIKHYQNLKLNAIPAKKGPDSVKRSYDFLLSHEIFIHPSCVQLIGEMETLTYEKDSDGNYKEEPVNVGDDLIAALRYGYSMDYMIVGGTFGFKSKLY
jgi:phage terminase large subunit